MINIVSIVFIPHLYSKSREIKIIIKVRKWARKEVIMGYAGVTKRKVESNGDGEANKEGRSH